MRYRRLVDGDYSFGNGQADFLIDSPEAVAQAVQTRLLLQLGEWFLDTSDGTPWRTEVLGKYTAPVYDLVLKERIIETQGMQSIDAYSSDLDRRARTLTVATTITTIYGQTTAGATL